MRTTVSVNFVGRDAKNPAAGPKAEAAFEAHNNAKLQSVRAEGSVAQSHWRRAAVHHMNAFKSYSRGDVKRGDAATKSAKTHESMVGGGGPGLGGLHHSKPFGGGFGS